MRTGQWIGASLLGLFIVLLGGPTGTAAGEVEQPSKKHTIVQEGSASLALQMMEEVRRREKEVSLREEELRGKEERLRALTQELGRTTKELEKREAELKLTKEKEANKMETYDEDGLVQLARLIEGGSAEQGARILSGLDPATAARVLSRMNPRKAGRFLSGMPPENALKVSQALLGIKR